jgi:hypothetical protein
MRRCWVGYYNMKMVLAVAAAAAACLVTCPAQAATVTVYNPSQLESAVRTAAAGDTIKVAPGNYGAFEFKNLNPASAISIIASNSANMPVFTNLKITNSSNLKLTRLTVSSPKPADESTVLYATTVSRSHDIRLSGMVIRGVLGGGVSNEARGLRLSQSTNVTVAGNSFTELSHAVMTDGSTRMNISDNGFTGIRVDGIMTDGATGSTITRNRFSDFRPEAGDHADAIQLFNSGNSTINLTVSDNLMVGDANGQMQGIFMTNASGDRAQLDQVKISNNLMWGTMYNGIAAFTGNRVSVTGNTLYSNVLLDSSKTWLRLEDISNATATGNYAGAYLYTSLGKLIDSGNVLSLLDLLAGGAVANWDATHAAAQLSLPYDDPDDLGFVDEPDFESRSFAARGVSAFAGSAASSIGMAALGGVPEPANWAMMIAGFGLLGTMRRRLQRDSGRRMARG